MMFAPAVGISLCLASASPRRRRLLASLGLQFQVLRPACAEPEPDVGEKPGLYALRLAQAKAASAQTSCSVIIAADTIVCIDGQILGKPQNVADALRMLKLLNGRKHSVYTAVALAGQAAAAFCEKSDVSFGNWPDNVLAAYAHCGEPLDKAGSYAIQGKGAFLVKKVDGSFTNVAGLPLGSLVAFLLKKQLIEPCAM